MISRGPLQPLPFCDSVTIVQVNDQYLEKDKRTQRDLTLKDSHLSEQLYIAGMDHEPANEINFLLVVQTKIHAIFETELQGNRN